MERINELRKFYRSADSSCSAFVRAELAEIVENASRLEDIEITELLTLTVARRRTENSLRTSPTTATYHTSVSWRVSYEKPFIDVNVSK